MANHKKSKSTSALGNASQKSHPFDFPSFDKDSPLTTAENSPNRPLVNSLISSTSSCTYFPDTNTNPFFYYYNHSPTLYSDLSLFYNPDCPLLLAHTHPLPLITFLYPASLVSPTEQILPYSCSYSPHGNYFSM